MHVYLHRYIHIFVLYLIFAVDIVKNKLIAYFCKYLYDKNTQTWFVIFIFVFHHTKGYK